MRVMLGCLAVLLAARGAVAGNYPLNLSLTPDVALHERSDRIEGVALSVWGENPQAAFSLGLLNGSTGDSAGLSIAVGTYAENYVGLQWSLVNYTDFDFAGWQGGFCLGLVGSVINYTGNRMEGLQIGVVNYAHRLAGVQLGVLNLADDAVPGVQIGILNVIESNTRWFGAMPDSLAPVMVLLNWRF